MMTPHNLNDFPTYWLASKALLSGVNPYGPVETHLFFLIPQGTQPLIPLNPPWMLPFMLWLGWFSLHTAEFLWLVFSIVLVSVSANWLAELYLPDRKMMWGQILALSFLPTLAVFLFGQSTSWVLFGIAGFLRYESKRPYLAGMFLLFVAFKPHLAFLVWAALALCAVVDRQWKPFIGFMSALALGSLAAVLTRPAIFLDYWTMMRDRHISAYPLPTLAAHLRSIYPPLGFLPVLAAVVWFVWYWRRYPAWDWKDRMPMLLMVSIAATPYSWFYDQIVILPALFDAFGRLGKERAFPATIYWTTNLSVLPAILIDKHIFSIWMVPAWLVLYTVFNIR